MILNLIFELLSAGPGVLSEAESLVQEIKAAHGGEAILKDVLTGVQSLASTIEAAL